MSRITARRRHPLARYAVLIFALAIFGVGYTTIAKFSRPAEATLATGQDPVAEGKNLFQAHCSSCHGLSAEGTSTGPTLIGVGAAAVDFQVSSGRMPAANPGAQAPRKPTAPWVTPEKIEALAAYVQSLGGGPTVPEEKWLDASLGSEAKGGELFRANCIQCHNWAGGGGALTQGKYAPALNAPSEKQIYEAMATGPQAMPVFNDSTITPEQKRDIIAYVKGVREQTDPGGFGLGRIGPVTEGLVAWIVGISVLALAAIWITAKKRQKP
ncbi:c-type cytochrome [Nonomuraea soli]|uniref:Cytochrome bc1 complex cytochrome c subunit n=1 Tax=Nonomuraea soli TaxID=1032476 RepID=A0A7W0HN64_9ACTN|nr:cytochrome c [Nonomuraea soli]MBA2889464.1 ubiquinol-cytochrome c reductase cytochrome c subunit [Nonomuraea soli]